MAHVIEEPVDAGILFGPSMRDAVRSGKTDAIPTFANSMLASVDDLRAKLREHGAIRGTVQPAKPHYDGPIAVLISNQTESAAEPLAWMLRRSKGALVVGKRTAGAMLSAEQFDLQNGWNLMLPVWDYVTPDGQRLEGTGVAPDVQVAPKKAPDEALQALEARR